MPTYVYVAVKPDESCPYCKDGFEAKQRMSDPPLKQCPRCNHDIRRAITPVGISTRKSTRSLLGDDNLKRHGFTKLVNEGDGKFRKT